MQEKITSVRFCEVISVDDEMDADRIKVRLNPEDNYKKDKDLEYAFPLLPKMFHVKPKVKEAVLVFLAITNDGDTQRYYVGPVISQDQRLDKDMYLFGADSFLKGALDKFGIAPKMNPEYKGLLPGDEDISIRGRKNADIQITDNDIRIKAGVKLINKDNHDMAFNEKNPGYIKTKYHLNPLSDGSNSTTAIVSDKILLLGHNSNNNFKIKDRENLIPEEEYNKIRDKAYKLPYGELLVNFLITFVNAFINHTHAFPMLPPTSTFNSALLSEKEKLLDKQEMLSDTVRID